MKLSKRQPILKWMKENVRAKHHGNCFFYAAAMSLLFPELKLMKGKPPHKGKGKHKEDTAHFWAEDKKGNIFDPTASQLEKDYDYKGKVVDAKKNIDFVIKDRLFKKLPEKDQETIKEITPRISKRSSWKEEERHEAAEVLRKHFPFIPPGYFGGWNIQALKYGGGSSWETDAFEAYVHIPGIKWEPRIRLELHHFKGGRKQMTLDLKWDPELGDFNTGLIGKPLKIWLENEEIKEKLPKILEIIESVGVDAETLKSLKQRGITEYQKPRPTGAVQNINFTELFPKNLFKNFIIENYDVDIIKAHLPPLTPNPTEPYYSVDIRLTYGGVHIQLNMPKMDPVFNEMVIAKTMGEFDKLIEPIKQAIDSGNDLAEEAKQQYPEEELELIGNQSLPISKRAQEVDLRKYFPAHVFGTMRGDKPQWFVTKYEPNEIEAYLRFHQGEVFLRVDKEQDKISWAMGWPEEVHPSGKEGVEVRWGFTNEYRGAEVENLSKGEFEEQLPQIHDLIAEFTLKKEEGDKDPAPPEMKEVFPPEIFKGWDTLKYEDTVIRAGSKKLNIYLKIMLIHHEGKPVSYNIFFELFNQDETSQYNIPVGGNFTEPIQVIKNIGAKAQAIKLESQTFSISKRAKLYGQPKEILEKFFPELSITVFGGWTSMEGREQEKTGREGELYGAYFMAWVSFPKQNNFNNGYFSIDATKDRLPAGHLSWPSQIGDFNLGLKVDIDRNTYTLHFDFPKDVEKIAPIITTIGGFAESMNLTDQRGGDTSNVVPIGKPYDPDLTELFPKEMFQGWDITNYRNSDVSANIGIKATFGAQSRGREKEVFIICQKPIETPAPLKRYAKQDIYAGFPQTQIDIETYDLNELKSLAPAIRILIETINENITKEPHTEEEIGELHYYEDNL